MTKTFKNAELAVMLTQLNPLLPHRDIFGYVAARNCRIISEALTEYFKMRDKLIEEYGEPTMDDKGQTQIVLSFGSPNFKSFCEKMAPYDAVTQQIDIMTAKYSDAIGCLSGEEILSIDWMLED